MDMVYKGRGCYACCPCSMFADVQCALQAVAGRQTGWRHRDCAAEQVFATTALSHGACQPPSLQGSWQTPPTQILTDTRRYYQDTQALTQICLPTTCSPKSWPARRFIQEIRVAIEPDPAGFQWSWTGGAVRRTSALTGKGPPGCRQH